MGVGYLLVNRTRAQKIAFLHLPASKAKELAGNPVTAAVTTWYLLQHLGDEITFVSDTDGSLADAAEYVDVTDDIISQLIDANILRDDGVLWADEDEPDSVYVRDLKNVWMA